MFVDRWLSKLGAAPKKRADKPHQSRCETARLKRMHPGIKAASYGDRDVRKRHKTDPRVCFSAGSPTIMTNVVVTRLGHSESYFYAFHLVFVSSLVFSFLHRDKEGFISRKEHLRHFYRVFTRGHHQPARDKNITCNAPLPLLYKQCLLSLSSSIIVCCRLSRQ